MASPPGRRQIFTFPSPPTSTSQTTPQPVIPTTTSTSTGVGLAPSSVSSVFSPIPSSLSSLSQSTSSSAPTPGLSSSITPSLPGAPPTPAPNGQTTTTGTTSTTAPPSTGAPESKGKSFLENKPLAGFVFGLAGLAALVIAIVAVTSYVRRRKQKRLLTDFSFDPKGVEGETSAEEKYSHSGLGGYHNTGHGHGDYPFDARARSVPFSSPPTPAYIVPHDYAGHDGGYPTGHHNPSNAAVGYNLTPNPYDMYGSRDDRRYSNGQDQYDIYNPYGLNGDRPSVTNTGIPVPRQLQPGAHPARGRTFAPPLSTGLPPFNRSPLTPSTILPPPVFLQPSASDQHDILRLPTPGRGALPDTFGRRESGDDDAYSGVFLGGDPPPPEPRRLQVANV